MKRLFAFILFLALAFSASAQVHVYWIFRDAASNYVKNASVTLQPIAPYGLSSSNTITGDRKTYQSDNQGRLTVSNLFNGRSYRIEVSGPNFKTTFTNSFDTNVVGLVNGADPQYIGAPIADGSAVGYTRAQADGRFLRTNISSIVRAGSNILITTNGVGASQYVTIHSTASGGGSLWSNLGDTIFPSGGSGSEDNWTSDGSTIYPDP